MTASIANASQPLPAKPAPRSRFLLAGMAFTALLGFHKIYSIMLLRAAAARLIRGERGW